MWRQNWSSRRIQDLHCVEDTDDDETKGTVGIVGVSSQDTDSLADGGGGAESHHQNPGPDALLGVGDLGDTGTETETFEHLMEENGDEQDDEAVNGERDGDADEDGVEQDTALEDGDLGRHLLVHGGVDGLVLGVKVLDGVVGVGVAVVVLGGGVVRGAVLHHLDEFQSLANVLLVKDDEPGRHVGLGLFVAGHEGVVLHGAGVLVLVHVLHLLLVRVADAAGATGPGGAHGHAGGGRLAGGASVGVAAGFGVHVHFDDEQAEHGAHHDDAGHGGILDDE